MVYNEHKALFAHYMDSIEEYVCQMWDNSMEKEYIPITLEKNQIKIKPEIVPQIQSQIPDDTE